jgi:hypothetical protein
MIWVFAPGRLHASSIVPESRYSTFFQSINCRLSGNVPNRWNRAIPVFETVENHMHGTASLRRLSDVDAFIRTLHQGDFHKHGAPHLFDPSARVEKPGKAAGSPKDE